MTKPADKRPNDAFAYLLSDNSDKANLLKIAALSDFQIGLPENPAELHVTGRSSYSCSFVEVQPGKIINFPNDVTILLVSTIPYDILKTGIYQNKTLKTKQTITVVMPQAARVGQVCYVKDVSGTADSCNIILQLTKLAGEETKIIDYKNGCIGFVWTGIAWSAITDGGQDFSLAEKNIRNSIQAEINDYGVAPLEESYVVLSSNSSLPNRRVLTAGSGITITDGGAGSNITISAAGGGSGDVIGPASSTDNAIVRFNGLLGKTIQNSGVTIDDSDNVTVPGRITVTGGTTTNTDANLGNAAVGSFPYYDATLPSSFALFGHKDLNHAYSAVNDAGSRNYALVQDSSGNTYVNASTAQTLYLSVNNTAMGAFTDSLLGTGISSILLTGDLTTRTNIRLGNTTGASITQIYAGTAGISISGSATTTITGSTSNQTELIVGTAEIGEFPYTRTSFPSYFAMFGHKTLDHSTNGNYAVVQSYNGDSFLNSPTTIYLQNAGNLIGYLDNNNISLTGQASTPVTTEIGSVYGVSSTTIKGGAFGLILTGSGTTITITGSTTTQSDAYIGSSEVGTHPFWGVNYAMFSHKDMNNSVDGNSALIQSNTGDTFLGAASGQTLYFKNGTSALGNINGLFTTFSGSAFGTFTSNATSINGNISLSLYGGSGGIQLSSSTGYTTITGSTSSTAEAIIGAAEMGELPATRTTFPSVYAFFGHKTLNHSSDGNYALVQSNVGDTFLGAASNKTISFKNGTNFVGVLDHDTVSFTGLAGTVTTTTLGNSQTTSRTSVAAGTSGGTLYLSGTYIMMTGSIGINLPSTRTSTATAGTGIHIKQNLDPTRSGTTITDNSAAIRIEDDDGDGWIIGAGSTDDNELYFSWVFSSVGGTGTSTIQGYVLNTNNTFTQMNFTGQHRCSPANEDIESFKDKSGLIVIATGDYLNPVSGSTTGSYNRNIGINDATPIIELSTARNDKRAFGVISDLEDVSDGAREFAVGKFVSVIESGGQEDNRVFINAIGEGAIWVCNINGNLENGDYITTCEIPGYGMKQDDDLLHNYTVAKITMNCNFDLNNGVYQCEEFEHEGVTYRRAFVGCTYHCG